MKKNRKPPQKFDSLRALIDELNDVGHPTNKIWYRGEVIGDKQSRIDPVAFIAADCRMIGQRHSDGTWWTLYGYDDPVSASPINPTDAFNLDEYWLQLATIIP